MTRQSLTNQTIRAAVTLSLVGLVLAVSGPVSAIGGLDRINDTMDTILSVLRGISVTVVAIAIIWAGYKFLYQHADLAECAKILGGGLLIGGASEIAQYLVGS